MGLPRAPRRAKGAPWSRGRYPRTPGRCSPPQKGVDRFPRRNGAQHEVRGGQWAGSGLQPAVTDRASPRRRDLRPIASHRWPDRCLHLCNDARPRDSLSRSRPHGWPICPRGCCAVGVPLRDPPPGSPLGSAARRSEPVLPGDELVPQPVWASTRALTIAAPREAVWPWLAQMGQDRAGLYSYERLENLAGLDFHNADPIPPEWQDIALAGCRITLYAPQAIRSRGANAPLHRLWPRRLFQYLVRRPGPLRSSAGHVDGGAGRATPCAGLAEARPWYAANTQS